MDCGRGKEAHRTRDQAERHARRLAGRHPFRFRVFYCEACGGWHVGKPRNVGREIRNRREPAR